MTTLPPTTNFDPENDVAAVVLDHDSSVNTIIVSDIHLGSDVSRSRRLVELLQAYTFRRLILNGDVFDDLNFTRLSKDDWRFLSYIRRMSAPKRGIDVVWVVGNHDGGVADILSHLLGVPVFEEYVWDHGGERFLAIHGHQFDRWITEHVTITAVASTVYLWLQKLDPHHRVSRWVKRTSKKWLRLSDKVGGDAAHHGARRHGATVVLCGHTHHATDRMVDGVRYLNSGCWTDKPSQYITVSDDGEIVLRECL
ncbi:MAG TPA: UDP-2,3-diacylglucosamine diphosphatase [Chlorobiota bacterium]|nr:UDP-2,3-diacylglucosamine diphosphatase [Chlorobiota bacterium]